MATSVGKISVNRGKCVGKFVNGTAVDLGKRFLSTRSQSNMTHNRAGTLKMSAYKVYVALRLRHQPHERFPRFY